MPDVVQVDSKKSKLHEVCCLLEDIPEGYGLLSK